MALVSAAVCPHPMMLIPEVAGDASGDWEQLRAACVESVRQLRVPVWDGKHLSPQDAPHLVVIVGGDNTTRSFESSRAYASLLTNGVVWEYGWGMASEEPQPLPLSLTLGYWLLSTSRAGNAGITVADTVFHTIDFEASPQECAALGQDLAGRAKRVAMLVMGEGSTCMTASAQNGERGRLGDAKVVRALEQGDSGALGRLDPREFRLTATGRAAWQVLAGAAAGQRFWGTVHAAPTPGDRGYFVASWTARPDVGGNDGLDVYAPKS